MRTLIHGIGRSGTTVVQRIINSCFDVWITNEFLLYELAYGNTMRSGRCIEKPMDYFKSLLIKDTWNTQPAHAPQTPPTLKNSFVTRAVAHLNEKYGKDTPVNRILTVEDLLYNKIFTTYGDKVLEPNTLKRMLNDGLEYKLIHVTRHCFQTVESRKFYNFNALRTENEWADSCRKVWKLKHELKDNYLQIKYEDLCNDNYVFVLDSISKFIGVSYKELERGYLSNFDVNHRRKYKIDEDKKTSLNVNFMLKELGY